MKGFRKQILGLLNTLNNITEPNKISYKVIFEFRYNPKFKTCYLNRQVTVFYEKTPVSNTWLDDDLQLIQYLCKQLEINQRTDLKGHEDIINMIKS